MNQTASPQSTTGLPNNIVFYCKDCHKIGPVNRIGRRYVYTCSVCGTKNVAFGTYRSISQYFRVKEEVVEEAEVEAEAGSEQGQEEAPSAS